MNTKEKSTVSVWARVTISPNHGLRANQTGLVIDEQSQGQKKDGWCNLTNAIREAASMAISCGLMNTTSRRS